MTETNLFWTNRTQAVRLAKAVAFPEGVARVLVLREDQHRIIVPADLAWDDFFERPGLQLPERDQPPDQDRDPL